MTSFGSLHLVILLKQAAQALLLCLQVLQNMKRREQFVTV